MKPRDPQTTAEWQLTVDAAEAALLIDSARQYGLIIGGPIVNVVRAEQILERGRARGIVPIESGVNATIAAWVRATG